MFIARIIVEFGVELAVIFDPKIDKKSIENSCKIDSKKQCENEAELGAVFHRFWLHLGTQDDPRSAQGRLKMAPWATLGQPWASLGPMLSHLRTKNFG